MHHLHGPPRLGGEHINKARGPVSCSTDMAIVNHMKGTSIHLRHSSLSQTRQKFNSHICQLLWHSWEITTTCAHEAVRQLKDTSACMNNNNNKEYKAQGKSEEKKNRMCEYMCSSVWWPMNDYRHYRRLSGTCKQGRRHTHVVQTAVYHTTSLETRTGSAFTVSHRLTRSRPLSLPAPYQH